MNTLVLKTLQQAKRLIVIVVGATVLLMGIAMIVLPGPAVLVIPVGLGLLATELVWARRLLNKLKSTFQKGKEKNQGEETQGGNSGTLLTSWNYSDSGRHSDSSERIFHLDNNVP